MRALLTGFPLARVFSSHLHIPIVVLMTRLQRRRNPGGTLVVLMLFVPIALFSQKVRVAELSLSSIRDSPDKYTTLAAAVGRFDVVAADDVRDVGTMEKVLAAMDENWEASASGTVGCFGFFYNDRVQLVKELGAYRRTGQFARPPFGAQFRLSGSGFLFNLIACHIASEQGKKAGAAEIVHLVEVYRYFEKLTGNRGITILAGRFGEEHEQAFKSLIALAGGEVIAVKGKLSGTESPRYGVVHMFASAALRPRIEDAGIGASTLHPVYVVLKSGK